MASWSRLWWWSSGAPDGCDHAFPQTPPTLRAGRRLRRTRERPGPRCRGGSGDRPHSVPVTLQQRLALQHLAPAHSRRCASALSAAAADGTSGGRDSCVPLILGWSGRDFLVVEPVCSSSAPPAPSRRRAPALVCTPRSHRALWTSATAGRPWLGSELDGRRRCPQPAHAHRGRVGRQGHLCRRRVAQNGLDGPVSAGAPSQGLQREAPSCVCV